MKVVVIVQARLKSKRLPKKVLVHIHGEPTLCHIVRRCRAAKTVHEVIVACPEKDELEIFEHTGICPIPGPEKDLLTRILGAARKTGADYVVRVTADCPLVDPNMIDLMVETLKHNPECDLACNWVFRKFPDGADLEVYKVGFLENLSKQLTNESDREYFASWAIFHTNPEKIFSIEGDVDCSRYRVTVDYPADLEVIRKIYNAQGNDLWSMYQVVEFLDAHPEIRRINKKCSDGSFGGRPAE